MSEIPKHYQPAEIEEKWYAWWSEQGYFRGREASEDDPYCIVIPPPNVTGILHMGHALNNTIQDVLIRWRRMQGRNVVWVPGTDHAGIATQNVVERQLLAAGRTRDQLGREAFLEEVWRWRGEYGGTIIRQLKRLGASCDWSRERFTMDEGLSKAVTEVFVRLYEKDLIYRGTYIINWCPRCCTALSDEESEHRQMSGKLYFIRYPLQGARGGHVTVATTRPETLLGDVALAVNPRDEKNKRLLDSTPMLPLINRPLRVIEDDFVDPEFGTGVVKVTPAHDPNDHVMGERHDLPALNVMNADGTMNEAAGPYRGMDRFECRRRLVEDLRAAGLLDRVEDHVNAVGHCYRCDTMVEPRLSPQWFVRMKTLAGPALQSVQQGDLRFVPERWSKVYQEWMENIRDWCISRQIWWGHRIPVFYCDACGHEWASRSAPHACSACRSEKIRQDEDVLDTWFSSWLWPFSVFGWPEETASLKTFYPTQTLVTAPEIIFFWVARMVMAGHEFMGGIPFDTVYIHGTVRAQDGRKMSKSLGNSIDPLDIIEKYSADALRFSLIMLTATGQDVYISDDKFEIGRNFGTKLWNAARFMQMQSGDFEPDILHPVLDNTLLSRDDKHILAQLHATATLCDDHLEKFRLNDAAKALYDFLWHQFCDWYLEYSKDVLNQASDERREQTLSVMHYVFAQAIKLLHPLMPFITEELWQGLGHARFSESIMTAPWPRAMDPDELQDWGIRDEDVAFVEGKHDLIRATRMLMADYGLVPKKNIDFIIRPAGEHCARLLKEEIASMISLLRCRQLEIQGDEPAPRAMPSVVTKLGTVYMSIEGIIDIAAEMSRLDGQLQKIDQDLQRINRKLSNLDFINKAPEEVVAQQEQRKKEQLERKAKLAKLMDTLKEALNAG